MAAFGENGGMSNPVDCNLWSSADHALEYLRRADSIPHRTEGEATLLEFVPLAAARILDMGSGDGRLLALAKADRPRADFVALDFSPAMLEALHRRFGGDDKVTIVGHDFSKQLPPLGHFDSVISSFAIHHVPHERKRGLYQEVFDLLQPGGIFCNLEHVASPTDHLHQQFLQRLGVLPEQEDPSNKLLDLELQLGWLREIGFVDVDCHWKWRELALFAGAKLGRRAGDRE
jgi:SAM-dependent methyltransferase